MKSSSPEQSQSLPPLGEKTLPTKPPELEWHTYHANPKLEVNSRGQLRTKPDYPSFPLPRRKDDTTE